MYTNVCTEKNVAGLHLTFEIERVYFQIVELSMYFYTVLTKWQSVWVSVYLCDLFYDCQYVCYYNFMSFHLSKYQAVRMHVCPF